MGNRAFLEFMTELLPMALQAERSSMFISNPDDNSAWIQCGTSNFSHALLIQASGSAMLSPLKICILSKLYQHADQHSLVNPLTMRDTTRQRTINTGYALVSRTTANPLAGGKK